MNPLPLLAVALGASAALSHSPELSVQSTRTSLDCIVAFSPDGRFLAQSGGPQVAIWDLRSGRKLRDLLTAAGVNQLRFTAQGLVEECGDKGTTRWAVETGEAVSRDPASCDYRTNGYRPSFEVASPDGKLVAAANRENLTLVDAASKAPIRTLFVAKKGDLAARNLAFSPDGRVLAACMYNPTLFSVETGAKLRVLDSVTSPVRRAAFTPDGRRLLVQTSLVQEPGSTTKQIDQLRVFDLAAARQVSVAALGPLWGSADILRDASGFFTGDDHGGVTRHEPGGQTRWSVVLAPPPSASSRTSTDGIAASPDGRRVAVRLTTTPGFTQELAVLDAESGKTVWRAAVGQGRGKPTLAFSLDGARLAFNGRAVQVFDANDGHALTSVPLELSKVTPNAMAFDTAGRLWVGTTDGFVTLFPAMQRLPGHGASTAAFKSVNDLAAGRDGRMASASADGTIKIWSAAGAELQTLPGHPGGVGAVAFSPDQTRLVSVGEYDGTARLWDPGSGKLLATVIAVRENDYVLATADGDYTASRGGVLGVAFRIGDRAVPFEQLDLRFNRPDKVAEALSGDQRLIAAYRRAHERRLRKLAFTERMLSGSDELPEVSMTSTVKAYSTANRSLPLHISAAGMKVGLRALQVSVNGSPVYGSQGLAISASAGQRFERDLEVALSSGNNRIEVSVVSTSGAESLRAVREIACEAPPASNETYVLAIGVSKYLDASYALGYAAKDAADVAAAFTAADSHVHALTLLDEKATRAGIVEARRFLEQAKLDDRVIVFAAGHGLLDSKLDYYFGTVDIDFREPAQLGLPYEELEGLLDGLKARRKLLLVDSCNSGALDKEEVKLIASRDLPEGSVKARAVRGVKLAASSGLGLQGTVGLLQELFVDVARGSGAAVISSAGGMEFALESDKWRNGVFTYALLAGLKGLAADRDKDGRVTVSELRDWVTERVVALTAGGQRPTTRRESLDNDFTVAEAR